MEPEEEPTNEEGEKEVLDIESEENPSDKIIKIASTQVSETQAEEEEEEISDQVTESIPEEEPLEKSSEVASSKVADSVSKEEREKLVGYVEAALFLAGRPISELEIAEYLNSDRLTVRWALRRIKRTLAEQNSALEVLNPTKDRWVLQLCEEFSRGLYDYIEQFIPKEAMLSPEEINALTEIAYRQPITSVLLAKISGRATIYDNIKSLHEKGFITLEKQEHTNLLKTSKKFADIYGFDTEMRNLKIQLVWRLKKRAKLDKNELSVI